MSFFEEIRKKNTAESTKRNYLGKWKQIIEWMKENKPEKMNGDTFIRPIQEDDLKEFLGTKIYRNTEERIGVFAESTVGTYISSIKYFMNEEYQQPLTVSFVQELKGFLGGMKREVSQCRQDGVLVMVICILL